MPIESKLKYDYQFVGNISPFHYISPFFYRKVEFSYGIRNLVDFKYNFILISDYFYRKSDLLPNFVLSKMFERQFLSFAVNVSII